MNEAATAHTPTAGDQSDAAKSVRLRAELQALASYIPTPIVRQQLASPRIGHVDGMFLDGSVLFADLSGFTALSETLSALGKQGAEEISEIINRLFGALLGEITRYGGQVLKFGGDALTAFFDGAVLGTSHAALASGAALALQQRMHEFDALATRAGVFRLRLRIGVHSGRVFAAQVGDAEHIELIVTGRTINRVALAQEIAESGEVVISEATLGLLAGAAASPRQGGFHLLERLPEAVAPMYASAPIWTPGAGDQAELAALEARIAALRPYLPRQLPRRFLEQAEGASGEFRSVSVLFVNFFPFSAALDLLGDDTATAAQVLNAYYLRAQQVIHRYGGIVNKVDMSTYGDKLMALFGAPTAHENSPELAVRAALELRGALEQANQEIDALLRTASQRSIAGGDRVMHQRIGINTGVMFAGMVGSQQRREYTVMGQHVNLAARLMAAADDGAVV
ncbi:MAG: adenylate/guanylate cyclase domain-containing protein, partial [Roseiflexaceae bacterium]|nr:adenylate/guanylate cyclase domain-containing protein [Roseiflexaceae bacterium]